jgi:RNA polymerase sigma-70 factor (ECF subfamily)
MESLAHPDRQDGDLAGLVARARAGNAAAFETLAGRVRARVLAWARSVTHDADEADDVAQLVLLKLHAHVRDFDGRSRFTTWLFRVTRNVAYNIVARERRRDELRASRPELEGPAADGGEPRRDDAAAAKLADLARYYRWELPPRQREVFELADLDGLNSTAIAERLGITPATVRGLLMKARRRIRLRMLEQNADLLEEYTP